MKKAVVLLFVVCMTSVALFASTITYTSRASFYAANPGVTVQGWDSLPNGTAITTLDGITYTPSTGQALVTSAWLPLSPPNTLGQSVLTYFASTDTMTFVFPNPILAFGISINTFDSSTGGYTATDNLGDVISSYYDAFPGYGTGEFVGFRSTVGFNQVTIAAPGGYDYTLDDLAYSYTPEPGSLLLLGSGMLGAAAMIRRKLNL